MKHYLASIKASHGETHKKDCDICWLIQYSEILREELVEAKQVLRDVGSRSFDLLNNPKTGTYGKAEWDNE